MKGSKARQIVYDALTYRGFSMAEADKLIKLLAVPTKEQVHEPVSKTIDTYV